MSGQPPKTAGFETTRFQKAALGALLVSLAWLAYTTHRGDAEFGLLVLAMIGCFFAFYRQLLWRVRNRLLVTYFLFGVVPIILIGLLLFLSAQLLLAGVAVDRARRDLNSRIDAVYSAAQDLARAAARGAAPAVWEDIHQRMTGLQCFIRRNGTLVLAKGDPDFPSASAALEPDYHGLSPGRAGVTSQHEQSPPAATSPRPAPSPIFSWTSRLSHPCQQASL